MAWPTDPRPALSLKVLRSQIDTHWPARRKDSDGMLGDAAHAKRKSDHNPWVKDGNVGVVTAIDITHDPARGPDCAELAEALLASRDKRIKYLIFAGRIASGDAVGGAAPFAWRKYGGASPHKTHLHLSVRPEKRYYDDPAPWSIHKGG